MLVTPVILKGFPQLSSGSRFELAYPTERRAGKPIFAAASPKKEGSIRILPLLIALGSMLTPLLPSASAQGISKEPLQREIVQSVALRQESSEKAARLAEARCASVLLEFYEKVLDPFLTELYGLRGDFKGVENFVREFGKIMERLPSARQAMKAQGITPEVILKLEEENKASPKQIAAFNAYYRTIEEANGIAFLAEMDLKEISPAVAEAVNWYEAHAEAYIPRIEKARDELDSAVRASRGEYALRWLFEP